MSDMKQYLSALDIPLEQKRYVMNFCKKIEYLDELHDAATKDTQGYVCSGFGDFNSNICFVFKDSHMYDIVRPLIQEVLDKFDINAWSIYVTFVNKTQKEYSKKYSFLVNELHAINPKALYVFDNDDVSYNTIIKTFGSYGITLPEKHFMINVQDLASTDIDIRKHLWYAFRYLINYKEIKQEG